MVSAFLVGMCGGVPHSIRVVEKKVCVRWNDWEWVCRLQRSIVVARDELFAVEEFLVVVVEFLDEAVGVSE